MLRISQIHGRLAKLGLQMNSSQQQFLNKRKKASVKNSNTEAGPVPLVLFDPDSTGVSKDPIPLLHQTAAL